MSAAKTKAKTEAAAPEAAPIYSWWMVIGSITYKAVDPKKADAFIPQGVTANVLSRTPTPKFGHEPMDRVHREFARRCYEEHGVSPNDITAITLHNICYLGEMTEDEMFGPKPEEANAEAPSTIQ